MVILIIITCYTMERISKIINRGFPDAYTNQRDWIRNPFWWKQMQIKTTICLYGVKLIWRNQYKRNQWFPLQTVRTTFVLNTVTGA